MPLNWTPQPLFAATVAALVVATASTAVQADIIPPHVRSAQERLRANPDTYDRVDQFCKGRKRGDACQVTGHAFEGGGAGLCEARVGVDIELTCISQAVVRLDRQIPEGGFGSDAPACRSDRGAVASGRAPADCSPPQPPVTDRFCRGLAVGSPCKAEMQVDGQPQTHVGVCQGHTESQFQSRYGGRRGPVRTVIQCEPARHVERQYTPASWLDKLRQ